MLQQNADVLDNATENELKATEAAIQAALAKSQRALPAVGSCHNCFEPVGAGERFCDEFCRDDYDHRAQRRQANAR